MSRRHQSMRSPLTLTARIVACCAVALTAGCGAGQVTQTDAQVAAIDGASADLGSIAIRDVLIPYPEDLHGVYPAGSVVPVQLTIVNEGVGADTLTSVTSPASGRMLVQGATTIPAGMSAASSGEAGQATATPVSPLDVGEVRIALTDTTRPLRPGQNIEITLVFQNAGTITLPVPMGPPPESVERQPLEGGSHD
ncbi:MAG: copper chaperone PCu(A)C [Pseudonocardiaceae bacterium]